MDKKSYLRLSLILVDPVVVDFALIPQRDGQLVGTALTLAQEEAPVDARTQEVFCLAARDRSVEPCKLVERVERGDVRRRNPANNICT